jgi:archaellum biogenesis ATPase FlaH
VPGDWRVRLQRLDVRAFTSWRQWLAERLQHAAMNGGLPSPEMLQQQARKHWSAQPAMAADVQLGLTELQRVRPLDKERFGSVSASLEELAARRQMAEALQAQHDAVVEGRSSVEGASRRVLRTAAGLQRSSGSSLTAASALQSCLHMLKESAARGRSPGLLTGIRELDQRTLGLFPGRLYGVCGRPGSGKSRLCLNMAYNISVIQREPVLYFSLEMPKEDLDVLITSRHIRMDYMRIFKNQLEEREAKRLRIAAKRWAVEGPPLKVVDSRGKQFTALDLRRELEIYRMEQKRLPAVIFVDYLTLLGVVGRQRNNQAEHEKINELTLDLKYLAAQYQVPVVTPIQLNREALKAARVGTEHVGGSDAPGKHADALYGLMLDDPDAEETRIKVTVMKQRYGSHKSFHLYANWGCTFVGDMPDNWEPPEKDETQKG